VPPRPRERAARLRALPRLRRRNVSRRRSGALGGLVRLHPHEPQPHRRGAPLPRDPAARAAGLALRVRRPLEASCAASGQGRPGTEGPLALLVHAGRERRRALRDDAARGKAARPRPLARAARRAPATRARSSQRPGRRAARSRLHRSYAAGDQRIGRAPSGMGCRAGPRSRLRAPAAHDVPHPARPLQSPLRPAVVGARARAQGKAGRRERARAPRVPPRRRSGVGATPVLAAARAAARGAPRRVRARHGARPRAAAGR
jgi:hypothetical protein